MTAFLLDVNLLLALCDPLHVHHDAAHAWFKKHASPAWATCPLTENAFVRIASHPSYPNRPGDAQATTGLLRSFCDAKGHRFWPDDISLREVLSEDTALTHAHVTDAYLLGLAVRHRGRLATFDHGIPVDAIPGGRAALTVLGPEPRKGQR